MSLGSEASAIVSGVVTDLKSALARLEPVAQSAEQGIATELATLINQADTVLVNAAQAGFNAAVSSALSGTPLTALLAAAESSALGVLISQGRADLEADALALKGLILSLFAQYQASAPVVSSSESSSSNDSASDASTESAG